MSPLGAVGWLEARSKYHRMQWVVALLRWRVGAVARCLSCCTTGLHEDDPRVPCATCGGLGWVHREQRRH